MLYSLGKIVFGAVWEKKAMSYAFYKKIFYSVHENYHYSILNVQ